MRGEKIKNAANINAVDINAVDINAKTNASASAKNSKSGKECGVLCAISSLPSPYGVGSLGKAAFDFIDLLSETGQTYWQLLPVNQTGFGDSPYAAVSVYAGSPYYIDLNELLKKGLLTADELKTQKNFERVNYGYLYETREKILKKAFNRYLLRLFSDKTEAQSVKDFVSENEWVLPYACFCDLKREYGGAPWLEWSEKDRSCGRKIEEYDICNLLFYVFLQKEFYSQYAALKAYARKKGIKIIGDVPIYPALDSAEVWHNKSCFLLDKKTYSPKRVAGVPPDCFSVDGQLWGNPVYDWKALKKQGYDFWIKRINGALKLYDVLRLDHFRGFESYYSLPFGSVNGKNGEWQKGGGHAFIRALNQKFTKNVFIAEDLGLITPEVNKLLRASGYPGMKVLQFAFSGDENNPYLPKNHVKNSVVYTGTHDNDTLLGWLGGLNDFAKKTVCDCLKISEKSTNAKIARELICTAMKSKSRIAIVPVQDYLSLGSEARMNVPSTAQGNWSWRIKNGKYSNALKTSMLNFAKMR